MKKLVLAVIALAIAAAIFGKDEASTDRPAATASDLENNARYACQEFLKQQLHNPKSADFGDIYSYPIKTTGTQHYVVAMAVRAENAFGAIRLTDFTCEVRLTDDNWHLLQMTQGGA